MKDIDYSITWQYIVKTMESKFGFAPDNTEKMSMHVLEKYINAIWIEYVDKLTEYYANATEYADIFNKKFIGE